RIIYLREYLSSNNRGRSAIFRSRTRRKIEYSLKLAICQNVSGIELFRTSSLVADCVPKSRDATDQKSESIFPDVAEWLVDHWCSVCDYCRSYCFTSLDHRLIYVSF